MANCYLCSNIIVSLTPDSTFTLPKKHIFSVTHIHSLMSFTWTFSKQNYGLCLDYDTGNKLLLSITLAVYDSRCCALTFCMTVIIYHVATDFVLRRQVQ